MGFVVVYLTELGYFQSLRTWNGQLKVPRLNRNIQLITLIVRYTTKGILWIDTIKFPLFFDLILNRFDFIREVFSKILSTEI